MNFHTRYRAPRRATKLTSLNQHPFLLPPSFFLSSLPPKLCFDFREKIRKEKRVRTFPSKQVGQRQKNVATCNEEEEEEEE